MSPPSRHPVHGAQLDDHTANGIAVPGSPVRAAAAAERRLLPHYRQAVEAVRGPALRKAHRLAQQAFDDWDAVSDSLCDGQGFPLDEDAYGIRQAHRDADAWQHFETLLFHGPAAIDHAKAALTALPLPASTTNRWNYQLRALIDALTEGTRIRDEWETRLAAVLDQQVGPDRWVAFDDTLAERNAESWHAITVFMDHGPVLHAITDAERQHAEFADARVSAATARSTIKVPRPGPRPPAPGCRRPRRPPPTPPPTARPQTPGR